MVRERILTLAVTFLLLSSMANAFGENSTDYYQDGSASDEKTITLDGENMDSSVSIKFPAQTKMFLMQHREPQTVQLQIHLLELGNLLKLHQQNQK